MGRQWQRHQSSCLWFEFFPNFKFHGKGANWILFLFQFKNQMSPCFLISNPLILNKLQIKSTNQCYFVNCQMWYDLDLVWLDKDTFKSQQGQLCCKQWNLNWSYTNEEVEVVFTMSEKLTTHVHMLVIIRCLIFIAICTIGQMLQYFLLMNKK